LERIAAGGRRHLGVAFAAASILAVLPATAATTGPVGGDRPVEVVVPKGYDAAKPTPLVLLLHPYGGTGASSDAGFGLRALAAERGFLLAIPEGMVDRRGRPFWNATAGCCDFDGTKVDDSAHLRRVIEDVQARWNVDDRRIFTIGFSNGGFMSHRMACDHADLIAGFVSIAGVMDADPKRCRPSEPVHVLQIHGTADDVIHFDGGSFTGPYPGAKETVRRWVEVDGCGEAKTQPPIDAHPGAPGNESKVTRWTEGCRPGGSVELWEMEGVGHSIPSRAVVKGRIGDWLLSHAKPAKPKPEPEPKSEPKSEPKPK